MNNVSLIQELKDLKNSIEKILSKLENRDKLLWCIKEYEIPEGLGKLSVLKTDSEELTDIRGYWASLSKKDDSFTEHEGVNRLLFQLLESLATYHVARNVKEVILFTDVPLDNILEDKAGPDILRMLSGIGGLVGGLKILKTNKYPDIDKMDEYAKVSINEIITTWKKSENVDNEANNYLS